MKRSILFSILVMAFAVTSCVIPSSTKEETTTEDSTKTTETVDTTATETADTTATK